MLSVALRDLGSDVAVADADDGRFIVIVQGHGIGEFGPDGFRLGPNNPWEDLRVTRPEQRLRIISRLREPAAAARASPALPPALPPDDPPAMEPVPVDPVPQATIPKEVARLDEVVEALQRRGVLAKRDGGTVVVDSIGPIQIAEGSPKIVARTFIAQQTAADKDALIHRVTSAAQDVGLRLAATMEGQQIIIGDAKGSLARVTRYGMHAPGVPSVVGDLLENPELIPHLLTDLVARHPNRGRKARPEPPAAPPAAPMPRPSSTSVASHDTDQILTELPTSLPASAREQAMAASERLRRERSIVPAVSVEIRTSHGVVTFMPLKELREPLEATFTFVRAGDVVEGGLRLKRKEDPISCRVAGRAARPIVAEAWAAALIVYAELTCVVGDDRPPEPALPTAARSRGAAASSSTSRAARRSPRRTPSNSRAPQLIYAQTYARAIEQLRSVSGHLRRLQEGQSCSAEQQAAATAVGIRIPPGFTWVRPHRRGSQTIRIQLPGTATLW